MGWWKLEAWKDNGKNLTEEDIQHILELVEEGYTEGELVD